jgi:NitT/TauT family transport system permease protein
VNVHPQELHAHGLAKPAALAKAKAPAALTPARKVPAGNRAATWLLGGAGLLVLLFLWWLGTDVLAEKEGFASRFSPVAALPSLADLVLNSDLLHHAAVSLKRVLVGLSIALLIGVPVGLLVGRSRFAEALTTPSFQFLRMISPLSWMPIAVMVLGIGDAPIYCSLSPRSGRSC